MNNSCQHDYIRTACSVELQQSLFFTFVSIHFPFFFQKKKKQTEKKIKGQEKDKKKQELMDGLVCVYNVDKLP